MKRWIGLLALMVWLSACMQEPEVETPELRTFDPAMDSVPSFGAAVQTLAPDLPLQGEGLAAPLVLHYLTCRTAPPENLLCVGWVDNPQAIDYQDVTLQTALVGRDGDLLAEETVMLSRDWLPAGEGSPFEVLFKVPVTEDVQPRVTLLSATQAASETYIQLDIENLSANPDATLYHIQGEVVNTTARRIAPVEILCKLVDNAGQVLAFRTLEIEAMPPHTRTPFSTTLTVEGAVAGVEVVADGYQRE